MFKAFAAITKLLVVLQKKRRCRFGSRDPLERESSLGPGLGSKS